MPEVVRTKKFLLFALALILVLLILAVAIIFSGKAGSNPAKKVSTEKTEQTKDSEVQLLRGFNFSPKSFSNSDFTSFLRRVEQSSALTWAGDWNQLGDTNSAPYVLTKLASSYDYEPIVIVGVFHQGSGELLRPLSEANLVNYKKVVVSFAEEYQPKYLGLGLEINLLYEVDPENFETFAAFFHECYLAIKSVSKNTKVFTTFQLEKMKGLHGGLFGGVNSNSNAQWSLLDKFPDSDLIGLTTYPSLIYKSPNDLSPKYYSDIANKTNKALAFIEIGWPADSKVEGWETDQAEQAAFVDKFFEITKETKKEIEIWPFLYDPDIPEPFSTLGLLNTDDSERPAYKKWIEGK